MVEQRAHPEPEGRVEQFRTSVTEHVDGIQKHLEERLDGMRDEIAELRRMIEQIDLRLRYLEDTE